jgi:hypothetical protein
MRPSPRWNGGCNDRVAVTPPRRPRPSRPAATADVLPVITSRPTPARVCRIFKRGPKLDATSRRRESLAWSNGSLIALEQDIAPMDHPRVTNTGCLLALPRQIVQGGGRRGRDTTRRPSGSRRSRQREAQFRPSAVSRARRRSRNRDLLRTMLAL